MNTELNDNEFRNKILGMLQTGNVEVEFTKKDGTDRKMRSEEHTSELQSH